MTNLKRHPAIRVFIFRFVILFASLLMVGCLLIYCLPHRFESPVSQRLTNNYHLGVVGQWIISYYRKTGHGPPFVADGSSAALRHSWRVSFACSQSRFISSKYNFALSPESQLNLSLGEHVEHVASATGGNISRATVFAIRHEKEESRFLEHCQTDTTVACPVAFYLEGTDVMWNSADDAPTVDWESLDSVSVLFLSFHKDSTKETELWMEVNRMSGIDLKRLMFVQ